MPEIDVIYLNAKPASGLLKAMGNHHRLMVVCHLMAGEKSVGELERIVGLSQSALSQHLARLRRENLVKTRRQAQSIYYSLDGDEARLIVGALSRIFGAGGGHDADAAAADGADGPDGNHGRAACG